jgi:hypothetical protein
MLQDLLHCSRCSALDAVQECVLWHERIFRGCLGRIRPGTTGSAGRLRGPRAMGLSRYDLAAKRLV